MLDQQVREAQGARVEGGDRRARKEPLRATVRVRVTVRVMGEADDHKLRPLEEQPRLERTAPRDEARGRRRARRACELRGRAEDAVAALGRSRAPLLQPQPHDRPKG